MILNQFTNFDNFWFPRRWEFKSLQDLFLTADFNRLRNRNSSKIVQDEETKGNLTKNTPDAFRRNLKSMIGLSRGFGFNLLLCTISFAIQTHRGTATSEQNNILRETAREYKIGLLDLDSQLSFQENIFCDGLHMNVQGQKLKAELIGDTLKSIINTSIPMIQKD